MSHTGTMLPYEAERDAAIQAALRAGKLIRRHAGSMQGDGLREKGVHDLVTVIDEQAQEQIIGDLREAFPDYAVLAEEGDTHSDERVAASHLWIIDPIDGTTNFTHGVPPYAVSIGLQHEGQIVVGVVYDAAHDDLFTAIRGGGAYANGVRMQVSRRSVLDDCLITTGFPYQAFEHVDAYLGVLRRLFRTSRGVRRPGVASIDLAYVAWGRFDAFFETGLSPWDVAAGLLLVEEAGGRVTDYSDAPGPVFARQILASNGRIHAQMLDALHPMKDVTA